MIAVDASALVAIAVRAPGHEAISAVILDKACVLGTPTLLESYDTLRRRGIGEGDAARFCQWIRELPNVTLVPFDGELLSWAQLGLERYAAVGLSASNAMSYGIAKHYNTPLLVASGAFHDTDLEIHPSSRTD